MEDAREVLHARTWRMLVGGELSAAADGTTADVVDPSTGAVVASVPVAGAADVDRACQAAQAAFPAWAALTIAERGGYLRAFGAALGRHADELALIDAIDSGNPLEAMRAEVDASRAHIDNWLGVALALAGRVVPASRDNLHYITYRPYGVVARIVPFNHPQLFAATRIIAPLLAGNTVVLKPAEQTPLTALVLAELAWDVFPPGVLNIVTGAAQTGGAIVAHPLVRRIGFIGGVATGRLIQEQAARHAVKNVTLELGGKNALIAFPDAGLDSLVEGAVRGMNFGVSQGQSCGSTSRVFVHEALYAEFVDAMAARMAAIRVGRAYDPGTEMGPVVTATQLRRVGGYIEDGRQAGARLVTGGGRPDGLDAGYFLEPTLFADVTPDMRIAREEIFGPVVCVSPWHDYDEVIAAANGVDFGLTASVWTQDLTLAHKTAERIDAGYVWINDASTHYWGTPFGGVKESGLGREESVEELLSYLEQKVTHVSFREPHTALAAMTAGRHA